MDYDISTSILQDVLQSGQLNYHKTVDTLVRITNSQSAQFFELLYGLTFVCKYSSTSDFVTDKQYGFEDLPSEQYAIFHKSNIIAVICLSNQKILNELPGNTRQRIHDAICIGLVMGSLRDSKYSFVMSVCQSLSNIVTQIYQLSTGLSQQNVPKDQQKLEQMNIYLNQVIAVIYDTIDYIEIDSEKIILDNTLIDIRKFINDTTNILSRDMTVTKDIDDNVPQGIFIDKDRVLQMLVSVLKKVSDLKDIHLHTSFVDYSSNESSDMYLIFRLFSHTSRNNLEILKRFQIEHVSVTSLDVFVVKRLCEIMKGTFDVTENGIILKIVTDVPKEEGHFRSRKILVGTRDAYLSNKLIQLFNELGASVTFLDDRSQNAFLPYYDLMLIDSSFTDVIPMAKRRGIPVVGVLTIAEVAQVKTINFDAILSIPVTVHELKMKCEKLLHERRN